MARATPRSSNVAPHIGRLSRSQLFAKKGLHKRQPKPAESTAGTPETHKTVEVKGDKNGGKRLVPIKKAPRFYPSEDVKRPKASRKAPKPTKLRGSIVPGAVLILLAGRFRGKRVVFLKQLESGLLLVTGPFKLNGVPLRRVNQAYVIATSTNVDISGVSIDEKLSDSYFKKEASKSRKGTEGEFFKDGQKEKTPLPESRSADQKAVDKALIPIITKTPHLTKYLSTQFSLSRGQYPHLLKF